MSPAEAEQVRKFHAAGGTVIADRFCGLMDEHGKWLDERRSWRTCGASRGQAF